jgi:hypothetical protein
LPEPPKKRLWRRRKTEPSLPIAEPSLPIVEAKGVLDVALATLECILPGESIDEVDAVVDLIQDPSVRSLSLIPKRGLLL